MQGAARSGGQFDAHPIDRADRVFFWFCRGGDDRAVSASSRLHARSRSGGQAQLNDVQSESGGMVPAPSMPDDLVGRALVRATSEAIIACEGAGFIQLWSPGAERVFGHSKEEALGQSLDLIIPERFRSR